MFKAHSIIQGVETTNISIFKKSQKTIYVYNRTLNGEPQAAKSLFTRFNLILPNPLQESHRVGSTYDGQ